MDIKNLTDDLIGKKVICNIYRRETEAMITKERSVYYLLQNTENGESCGDKKGYKYSWTVGSGSKERFQIHGISNMRLITNIHELWI